MREACQQAADDHGATVDFDAENIYQTYKIPEDAQPYREAAAAIRSLGLEVVPRASRAAAPTATSSTPRASRAWRCRRGWSTSTRPREHIAIEDMVTACRILVAIATRGPEQEDER